MGTEAPQLAYAIREFCRSARISASFFYRLCREGQGPTTFKVGRRRYVGVEAARAWLERREELTAEVGGRTGRQA
ncbi:helix-turn-helix domain-containing protein [Zeimonas arvi]|uniref:Helix-turn-helix domain-containing protein n=1 Tax=Zeimonas arvi TaxID=2498847 RepID=A0A5C8NNJ4_9BURK|nr:helix-turn-helix domain-containing protein [Zeimonas arvi]